MDKEQAFNIISNVCSSFNGNLKDHKTIQEALSLLKPKINEPLTKEKKK